MKPWNIIEVPAGANAYDVYQQCKKKFPCQCWDEERLKGVTNQRETTEAYTVEFAPNIEADEELKNRSARSLEGVSCIALVERLLLELQYFKATGGHLDVTKITLCASSRYSDGDVPCCYWHPDSRGFYVDWFSVGNSSGFLRARQVVSCSLKPSNLTPSVVVRDGHGRFAKKSEVKVLSSLATEIEYQGHKYILKEEND